MRDVCCLRLRESMETKTSAVRSEGVKSTVGFLRLENFASDRGSLACSSSLLALAFVG
jgi:hypothetical protein